MRIVSILMALVFLVGAAVQYNDPDPVPWMLVYVAAAALSFRAYRSAPPWWSPALLGAGTLVWTVVVAMGLDPAVVRQMFEEFGMRSLEIEEAREALGLLIITVWMFVLAVRSVSYGRSS
jgi:hypothetical protein